MALKSEPSSEASLLCLKKDEEDGHQFLKSGNTIPSLSKLCYDVIASKLERYPPECLAVFSEMEWEKIVKVRHKLTEPKKIQGWKQPTRMSPAISGKFMMELERVNSHLAKSDVADKLIWKDVVEYKFRRNGNSRPVVLLLPWPILVGKLKNIGENLLEILSSEVGGEKVINETLENYILCMVKAPMCVPLLVASGIGKAVHKFLKLAKKLDPKTSTLDIWSPLRNEAFKKTIQQQRMNKSSPRSLSAIEQLEKLLQGWKHIASENGVSMQTSSTTPETSLEEYSGRAKNTTLEQHNDDIATVQTVDSWRKLYSALLEREIRHKKKYGARMREIRDDLKSNRKFVKKVETKTGRKSTMQFQNTSTKDRLDAILVGKPVKRAGTSTVSIPRGNSKIQALKKEAKHIVSRQGGGKTKSASTFGCSVGFASTSKKRPAFAKGREIALNQGKKMKLPEPKAITRAKNNHKRSGAKNVFSFGNNHRR